MISNSLIFLARNFKSNTKSHIISILGLCMAFAIAFLILMYIHHELTWDSHNKNINRLFYLKQKVGEKPDIYSQTPAAIADYLKENYPGVENTCLMRETWGDFIGTSHVRNFYQENGYFADPSVFSLFTFQFIEGNPDGSLNDLNAIVISESIANRLFPDQSAIGKIVIIDKKYTLEVKGVYKDWPTNSHIRPSYLCSFQLYNNTQFEGYRSNWEFEMFRTYIKLKDKSDYQVLSDKIANLRKQFTPRKESFRLYLDPVNEQHLSKHNKMLLMLYGSIALLVVLLAAINYINIMATNFVSRTKELAIKKVMGAKKNNLFWQLLNESLILVMISISGAFILTLLFMPIFYQWMDREISFQLILHWKLLIIILLVSFIIALVATIFPLISLFSNYTDIAKQGYFNFTTTKIITRKSIVAFQFLVAICLISSSLIVNNQLKYIKTKDIGFNKEDIVYTQFNYNQKELNLETIKSEAEKMHGVISISYSNVIPFHGNSIRYVKHEDRNDKIKLSTNWVCPDFITTYGIELIDGRNFSDAFSNEHQKCIISKKSARLMNLENPVGQWIKLVNGGKYQIIGIVKDYHRYSLTEDIPPVIMFYQSPSVIGTNIFSLKLRPGNRKKTLTELAALFDTVFPGASYEFWSFSDRVEQELDIKEISNTMYTFLFFTLISILISLLGLYSIVTYQAKSQTKEIGIRKVNGARISEILVMLNKDFVKWVLIAFLVACPITWYAMNKWLENFVYRTELNWRVFAVAGSVALIIALITVNWQSWKAASRNPVEALRYE